MKKMPMMMEPAYSSPLVRRLMGRKGKKPQALYAVRGEKHAKGR